MNTSNPPHSHRAEIGGLDLAELNALELEFLFAVGFRLFVAPEEARSRAAALPLLSAPPHTQAPQPACNDSTMPPSKSAPARRSFGIDRQQADSCALADSGGGSGDVGQCSGQPERRACATVPMAVMAMGRDGPVAKVCQGKEGADG